MRLRDALAARSRGDVAAAAEMCRRIIRDRPEDVRALHLLGIIGAESGDLHAAQASLQRAAQAGPSDVDVALSLGKVLDMRADRGAAVEALSRALALAPGRVDIALALADTLQRAGESARALDGYNRILASAPDHLGALVHSGILLMKLGYGARGATNLRRAAAHSDDPVILYNLAMAERALGRSDRALALLDQVLARRADYAEAWAGKAQALHSLGRTEEAHAAIATFIERRQATPAVALAFAQIAGRMDRLDDARALLRGLLDRGDLEAHDTRQLFYALGKVEDACGRYDDAFTAFRSANDLSHRRYDAAAVERRFCALRAAFAEPGLTTLPRSRAAAVTPILIVGMPRSGTTLVEQILDSHRAVAGCGELPTLQLIADRLAAESGYPHDLAGLGVAELDRMAEEYRGELRQAAQRDATLFTDKMPANFEHLGLAALIAPSARVVYCRRDPRDCGLSCYMQSFRNGNAFADDLAAIGHQSVACSRLMEHWRAVLPLPMIDVAYEALVADPEPQIRRLLEFLGLDWDPACLAFYANRRLVHTASFDQVREPIHRRAVGRWRNYRAHLGPMMATMAPILLPD